MHRSMSQAVFSLTLILGLHSSVSMADQDGIGRIGRAVVNSSGDAWGTTVGGSNALAWELEPAASEYVVYRSDGSQVGFVEQYRTPLTNGVDFPGNAASTQCYRIEATDDHGRAIRQYPPVCLTGSTNQNGAVEGLTEPEGLVGCPPPYSTIDSMCLSDSDFVAATLGEVEVEAFLTSNGSFLQGNIPDVDGVTINPAHEIFEAAQTSMINPRVILATLEKENSAISLGVRPSSLKLRTIMGYNVTVCQQAKSTCSIREQIADATAQFRLDMNRLAAGKPAPGGNPPWQVGITTPSLDPLPVTPAEKAVATLFSYTPWVGQAWCGRKGVGGNGRFCQVWAEFGFSGPPPSGLTVSLTAVPSSGPAPLNGVTLQAVANNSAPNETLNYTFYCNRSDSGTNITPNWDKKYDSDPRPRATAPGICSYATAGTYTAKVIVEQGTGAVESRTQITVGNPAAPCYPLTLAANDAAGGSVPIASPGESSSCAAGQYVAGEEIQLAAAPASGWSVGSWSGTADDPSTSDTNSLVMPAAAHSVTVNYVQSTPGPLTITTTSLPDGVVGQPYTTTLAASGGTGTGYHWSIVSGSLPAGLSGNAQSGVISGTPTQGGVASNFTVGVTDSGGDSASRRFSLYVEAAPGLTITSSAAGSFVFFVGDPYTRANSITYTAEGGQAPYAWSATGLPLGLQIDPAGGFLYGMPTATGSYAATITAEDSMGKTGSLPVVLQVTKTAITISGAGGQTPANPPAGQVGKSYVTFFEAAGGSNAGFQWSVQGSLPPGLVSENGPGCPANCALEVTGTPTFAGTYPFTVSVTDSLGDHASQAETIVVNSGTPPSITTAQLPTATIGAAYTATLSATGGTPPYRWSFVGTGPDPGITLSQGGTLGGASQNTNDCPTGSADHLGGLWVGAGYPSTYFQVLVTDAAGQSSSKQLCLVSYYPRPQVSSDTPSSVTIDGGNHTVTLNGANFRSTSYIVTNYGNWPVSYSGPNAISFTLYAAGSGPLCLNPNGTSCLDAQTLQQSVIEPYSDLSATSVAFPIYNPAPTLSSVQAVLDNTNQPCTANQLCQLIVNGSGFSFIGDTNLLIVEPNLTTSAASYPSGPPPWGQIITGTFSLPSGTYTLQVTNTHQAGGSNVSASMSFQVN